jgi:hypothetical protein
MLSDILALLRLFEGRVPDPETHAWVLALASEESRWPEAHDVFDRVRGRLLKADQEEDEKKQCQYSFEEVCLKSLFNETATKIPFDSDSPHWITSRALFLARALGIPEREVIGIIAPYEEKA